VTTPANGGAPVGSGTVPAVAPVDSAQKTQATEAEIADQNLFRKTITDIFKTELVIEYPDTPGHLPDVNYAADAVPDGTHTRVRFRVNLVPLPSGPQQLDEKTVVEGMKKALVEMQGAPGAPARTQEESLRRSIAAEVNTDLALKLVEAQGNTWTYEVTTGVVGNSPEVERRAFEVATSALDRNTVCTIADPFPRVDTIGGAVAKNLKMKAFVSMFFAIIAIVIYVAFRFEFIWGIGAILSLVHDLFTTMGFIAIMDTIFSVFHVNFDCKINLPTVAAFLTLLGYSIADTIVVYDRIREKVKLAKQKHADPHTINDAINGTLSRTILTSLTVFFVAVVLFGCSFADLKVIQGFSVAMCFGVVTGTYSSIFVAAPVILSDLRKLKILVLAESAFIIAAWIVSGFLH
jgi:preprotein translocase SecF subunit